VKTIKNLTGEVVEGAFVDGRGAPAAFFLENPERKGTFVHVFVGPGGVRFRGSNGAQAAVPIDEVMALLKRCAPEVFAVPDKKTPEEIALAGKPNFKLATAVKADN
jgi:hypothetical protein